MTEIILNQCANHQQWILRMNSLNAQFLQWSDALAKALSLHSLNPTLHSERTCCTFRAETPLQAARVKYWSGEEDLLHNFYETFFFFQRLGIACVYVRVCVLDAR